jgi:hypothetical protein
MLHVSVATSYKLPTYDTIIRLQLPLCIEVCWGHKRSSSHERSSLGLEAFRGSYIILLGTSNVRNISGGS